MHETLVRLAITQSELFSSWPDEAIGALVARANVVFVEPGTCVHFAGDQAEYVSLVVAGSMTLTREMSGNRNFTSGFHFPGDFHGLGPVIAQAPHMFNAICKEKTVIVQIPGGFLREMVAANGRLSFSLFSALERRYTRAQTRHASAAVDSTQTRLAALLKHVNSQSSTGHASSEIHFSQDELATMLGTRRQVVNRVLKEIAAKGVIRLHYGRIEIIDNAKLDQLINEAD